MDSPGLRVSRKTFPQLAKRIPFPVSNFDHPSGIANLATGLEFSGQRLVCRQAPVRVAVLDFQPILKFRGSSDDLLLAWGNCF
jgi:hypothetical protein